MKFFIDKIIINVQGVIKNVVSFLEELNCWILIYKNAS